MNNFERMMQLAEDVFAAREDPNQLDVDADVIEHLKKIHSATVSEAADEQGPYAWILLIPTTRILMQQFMENKISERDLYENTPLNATYEAIYLCSAMVLEDYQRKGVAKNITLKAISEICKDHPIKALFVWPFTKEGELSAEKLSQLTYLPLHKKLHH